MDDGSTEQLGVCIGAYEDQMQFNILPLHRYDAILGAPWLQEHNPIIDWKKGEVRFTHKGQDIVLRSVASDTHTNEHKNRRKHTPYTWNENVLAIVLLNCTLLVHSK